MTFEGFPARPCASCSTALDDDAIATHEENHGADCECRLVCDSCRDLDLAEDRLMARDYDAWAAL